MRASIPIADLHRADNLPTLRSGPRLPKALEPGPAINGRRSARSRRRRTLLVPVDFTESSVTALDYGLLLAKRLNASMTLLHVVDSMHGEGFVDSPARLSARARAIEDARLKLHLLAASKMDRRVPMECVVRHGSVEYEILRFAEIAPAHLIVLGRKARTALSRLVFGSVTREVLDTCSCAVVVVPESRVKAANETGGNGWMRIDNAEFPTTERRQT